MDFIHEPTDLFDFTKLSLNTPSLLNGGANGFFTKFVMGGGSGGNTTTTASAAITTPPLYIKTPICCTKAGFSINKKITCDLVFSREENETLNRWMENLVTHTNTLLFEHSDEWFHGGITAADIEEALINPIKSYKSGKYYTIRCGIKMEEGRPLVRVYDTDDNEITLEDVGEKDIVTLLECKGVRCSMRTFQIEFEIKQIMLAKKFNILEKNLLSRGGCGGGVVEDKSEVVPAAAATREEETTYLEKSDGINVQDSSVDIITTTDENIHLDITDFSTTTESSEIEQQVEDDSSAISSPDAIVDFDLPSIDLDEIDVDDTPVKIKKENELYYKMYQEAKQKAQEARKIAIDAYLEAKNIKTLYDLEDADENLDDFEMDF
jgi:hypothetical protein